MSTLDKRPEKPVEPTPEVSLGTIYVRSQYRKARPGSQRRCYYGCWPPSDWETLWSEWGILTTNVSKDALDAWPDFTQNDLKTEYKWEPNP